MKTDAFSMLKRNYGQIIIFIVIMILLFNFMDLDLSTIINRNGNSQPSTNNLSLQNNNCIIENFQTAYQLKYLTIGSGGSKKYVYIDRDFNISIKQNITPDISAYRVEVTGSNETKVFVPINDPNIVTNKLDIQPIVPDNTESVGSDDTSSIGANEAVFEVHKITGSSDSSNDGNYLRISHNGIYRYIYIPSTVTGDEVDWEFRYRPTANTATKFVFEDKAVALSSVFNPIIKNTLKLEIHPKLNEIELLFNVDPDVVDQVDNFMIILAKYDYKKKLLDHLKVHTSQEKDDDKGMCVYDQGIRKCKYKLKDIDHIDRDGNLLYYRIGVIPIKTDNKVGQYEEPVYPGGFTHFIMTKSVKEMTRNYG